MSERLTCFPPIVAADTRLLILGSLPGAASLAATRYYAHPRNQFWTLVGKAIGVPLAVLPYDDRLTVLRSHGIGLWDVVASGRRVGSLDTALRDAAPNDLASLVASLPALRAIAFNGATAARIGRKALNVTPSAVTLIDLPSSSPAFTLALADKAAAWDQLRAFTLDDRATG